MSSCPRIAYTLFVYFWQDRWRTGDSTARGNRKEWQEEGCRNIGGVEWVDGAEGEINGREGVRDILVGVCLVFHRVPRSKRI